MRLLLHFLGCKVLAFSQTSFFVADQVVLSVVFRQLFVVMLVESDVAVLVDFILVLVAYLCLPHEVWHLTLSQFKI